MDNQMPLNKLIDQATEFLSEMGYAPIAVYNYNLTWRHLLEYANKQNVEYFTFDFGMHFLEQVDGIKDISNLTKCQVKKIRRIKVLNDFMISKKISRCYRIHNTTVSKQFTTIYNGYSSYLKGKKQKERTIISKLSRIKRFFDFLDKKGITFLKSVTKSNILDFLSFLHIRYASHTRSNILFTLRDFLKYSSAIDQIPQGLNTLFQVIYTDRHERLPSFYSLEEQHALLNSVNRTTKVGKKDYVILLLAIQLGLRASDINYLMIDNIKWEKMTIEFVQQKTGKHLRLPITDTTKFALLDYLKNSRPNTSYNNVFIRQLKPHLPFTDGTAFYNIVNKYIKLTDVSTEGKHHGLHSLRHCLAVNLLKEKTSISVISGILGHSSSEITHRYLRVDLNLLRIAALEISHEK